MKWGLSILALCALLAATAPEGGAAEQGGGDTSSFQRFLIGVLLAKCHKSRHFVFGDLDFFTTEFSQTHICHFIRQISWK